MMIHGVTVTRDTKSQDNGMVCKISLLSSHNILSRTNGLTDPGIPKIISTSRTLATEIVSSTTDEVVFKLQQEYKPKPSPASKAVNSLVSLKLEKDEEGKEKVVYHKDMWNEKDYSHEGLGKVFKTLNGDHLTKITQPPKSL